MDGCHTFKCVYRPHPHARDDACRWHPVTTVANIHTRTFKSPSPLTLPPRAARAQITEHQITRRLAQALTPPSAHCQTVSPCNRGRDLTPATLGQLPW
jgi:hypothetical protein